MHLTVLGGGVADLAVRFYAINDGIPVTLYEGADRVGDNCITLQRGAFRFDSGAHRFHDKDPEITRDVQSLLGADLLAVQAPSQIYFRGRFIQFPLTPINVLTRLGPLKSARAVIDLAAGRLRPVVGPDFESFAVHAYGRTVADAFLLGYSEKLWGVPASRLSPSVSGQRLVGLNVRAFLKEAVHGGSSARAHLDGAFYYPKQGYGAIADALAARSNGSDLNLNSRITRLFHDGDRIRAIEVAGRNRVEVSEVVSTLPLTLMLKILDPQPPTEILAAARRLRFRNVVLVALFVDRPSITRNATVYFPSREISFTRVYEPKNRSPLMAPAGQTSVVAEIPCQFDDHLWTMPEADLIAAVRRQFEALGWFPDSAVIDACTYKIPYAYPVLEIGSDEITRDILAFLSRFRNLSVAGRSGRFSYTHLHDLMSFGRDVVNEFRTRRIEATACAAS